MSSSSGSSSSGRLAVIGGTNVSAADFAEGAQLMEVEVGATHVSVLERGSLLVLGRHGLREHIPAHRIDHLANLEALRMMGCTRILAVGSVGSLRPDWDVGTVVAPDDFFAPLVTPSTHEDARGHTVPGFDGPWRDTVVRAWRDHATTGIIDGGVYAQTTGPRFETPAEVRFLAGVADVVGMTLAAECILARELGLAYASVCMVDNLANGLEAEPLTLEEFEAGVATNRPHLLADLSAVVEDLVDA